MKRISRRHFLHSGIIASGALAFDGVIARAALFESTNDWQALQAPPGKGGYGPLEPQKTENTGEALLALPRGFSYVVLGKAGSKMADGHVTPARHDGMATFKVGRYIHIVRNHEINPGIGRPDAAFGDRARAYDTMAGGGTTTMVIDPKTRAIVRDYASLSGTLQNCCGGPTPWGSWITCEETILSPLKLKSESGFERGGFSKKHGYCFEVPATSDKQVEPVPLKAMGRFVHEAVAVDPKTGIVYETEDIGTAGLYRFLPARKGQLAAGGRLQMLAIKGKPESDLRTGQKVNPKLPVTWVDIADPDPPEADTDPLAVYKQGKARGTATFARLEGCWYGNGKIYFTSTTGGNARLGQVWELTPDGDGGSLRLLFESPSAELLDMPDNLCLSPRGGLVLCEDGRAENYVRGLTRDGLIFDLAKNINPAFPGSEFAGATFSPDGQTLFVNAQTPGMTFAIWGPWKEGAL